LKPGESVMVHGAAGGVGSIAVQLAKAMGGNPVIGSASTEEKRLFIRDLGADTAIDYGMDGWPNEVLKITDGHGVDVILESIGGRPLKRILSALQRLAAISFSARLAGRASRSRHDS
jgi:NADPH:quinone reductase